MTRGVASVLLIVVLGGPGAVSAEVERVVLDSRADVLGGASFGAVGPYEKLTGRIVFAFDPAVDANTRVVDLDKAPLGARGRVEAWAPFMVLRPKRPGPTAIALIEVSNRGSKAVLGYFNRGSYAADPASPSDFGDGLLMRLGLTVVWVGWQFDVPAGEGLLRLHVPVAVDDGRPITGVVRSDWPVDQTVQSLPLAHRNHVAYPVIGARQDEAVLTVRDGRLAPRTVVPRDRWRFARQVGSEGPEKPDERTARVVDDREYIYMASGFLAGKIYELVYPSEAPAVVGLGLAAIRDVASYAKYEPDALFPARLTIALGISQTGRFLRHFLYEGFNADERGRKALDGMLIHTAGAGRGSFNHRFAQPSRDAHRYSAFFYPTDLFPFASRALRDPETGLTDGLLPHALAPGYWPKIFYTNTGYEYWGRAAALIHTTPDGRTDVDPWPNERIYHLSSAQHFPIDFPPGPWRQLAATGAYRGNPLDFLFTMRALLVRLVTWVGEDVEPPPSAFPRIDAVTLVRTDQLKFPGVPGVKPPAAAHEAYRVDYGPRWSQGIITLEPPRLGPAFPALVPQVDAIGNEVGGVRGLELLVPLATYTPWCLRTGHAGGSGEMMDFIGTYVPLSRTEAERRGLGDSRPSVERLYGGREEYLKRAAAAATSLGTMGFLLAEDVPSAIARSSAHWDWLEAR